MVVQEREDLHLPGGDHPFRGVGLPQLVRRRRLETSQRRFRPLPRCRGTTNPRRTRIRQIVDSDGHPLGPATGEMPLDRARPGVEAALEEFLA